MADGRLDLSTIDPAQLAHAAETAAQVNLAATGILGACLERSTMRAAHRKIEHGQALASLALLMGFVAEHYETPLPVLLVLQEGSVVAVEVAAPVRAEGTSGRRSPWLRDEPGNRPLALVRHLGRRHPRAALALHRDHRGRDQPHCIGRARRNACAGGQPMRVLTGGGRALEPEAAWDWLEDNAHEECFDALNRASHVLITHVIQGGATGADTGADRWARASKIPVLCFRADWDRYGRQAGPLRNTQMLAEGRPEVVIALYSAGACTADIVRKARAAGLPVVEARI